MNEICMKVFFSFFEGNNMVPKVCSITWIFSLDMTIVFEVRWTRYFISRLKFYVFEFWDRDWIF